MIELNVKDPEPIEDVVAYESILRLREGFERTFGDPPNDAEIELILKLGKIAGVDPLVHTFDEIDTAIRQVKIGRKRSHV